MARFCLKSLHFLLRKKVHCKSKIRAKVKNPYSDLIFSTYGTILRNFQRRQPLQKSLFQSGSQGVSQVFCFSDHYYPIFSFSILHITGIYQVYLRCIPDISQAYIKYISSMSQVYLRHISGISQAYLRNILGIYQGYLRHISGISQVYLIHISGYIPGISQRYLSDISDISQGYL